jgi:hypothetical protein
MASQDNESYLKGVDRLNEEIYTVSERTFRRFKIERSVLKVYLLVLKLLFGMSQKD